MKGQKIKALATELKAHEKLLLSLKKKRHTIDRENEEGEDGESKMIRLQEANRAAAEDELRLERDLESILNRFHLPASLAGTSSSSSSSSSYTTKDPLLSDNHVNSVIGASKYKEKRFNEARVEALYRQGLELASRLFRETDESNEKDRRRRKSFEQWLIQLENDLAVLELKVKKVKILESQLDDLRKKSEDSKHIKRGQQDTWDSDKELAETTDIRRRLKELTHKIQKDEKELGGRIIDKKIEEFPTSRNLGDL